MAELEQRGEEVAGELVSIYIGGGTPSLWPSEELARVLGAVLAHYGESSLREVTLEANPRDCVEPRMAAWLEAGITRLSIGVQSYKGGDLLALGRDHHMGDGAAAIRRALGAGFTALTGDLILGAPGGSGEPGVERASRAGLGHWSVYELSVEEGTPLAANVRRNKVLLHGEDQLADLYTRAHEIMSRAGYEHYEISSYARPGHRSVHNSLYWQLAPYLGLGVGAASLRVAQDGSAFRQTNPRAVARYFKAPGVPALRDPVSSVAMARDRIWLGLRTRDGVFLSEFVNHLDLVDEWVDLGLVEVLDGRIQPTLRGFLMHNAMTHRIVAKWRYDGAA